MRVSLDYLHGPVLGHRRRCEILQATLSHRGHIIVDDEKEADWLVWDYPPGHRAPLALWQYKLVMGQPVGNVGLDDVQADFSWMPVHEPCEHTLTGKEYLILDPLLKWYRVRNPQGLLLSMGGADPYHITEKMVPQLRDYNPTVVIGSGFGRDVVLPSSWKVMSRLGYSAMLTQLALCEKAVVTWGQVVFELMYLHKPFITIATQPDHLREAEYLNVPCVAMDELHRIPALLPWLQGRDHGLDLLGADRVVDFMESICSQ